MIELSFPIILAALASGAVIGFFLGLFGGGGSVLAVPLLLYAVGVTDPHLAIGTSAAAVAAIALVNLRGHSREGRVKWPCALIFAGAGILGSLSGSWLALQVPGDWLLLGFSVAMAAIGLSMLRRTAGEGDPDIHITPALIARLAPLGFLTGLAAGFFGIGGGFLIVPGLISATGMTMLQAVGSSLFSVGSFGATTAASYAIDGLVDWRIAGLFIFGGVIGGVIGASLAEYLAKQRGMLQRVFAGVVFAVAGYMLYRTLLTPH